MKNIHYFFAIFLSQIIHAQSDFDKNQQLVYTHLYSKEFDKAKNLIDQEFLKSNNLSKNVIGYVYLADYYISNIDQNDETLKTEALETAKSIAIKTKNPIDQAYVDFGYARYFNKLGKNELFIKHLNNSIKTFSKHSNENFILTQLYFLRYKYKTNSVIEEGNRNDAIAASQHALNSKNSLLINFTYNNLAYYHINQFDKTQSIAHKDSAELYYKKSNEFALKIKEPSAYTLSNIVYLLNYNSFKARDENYNTIPSNLKIIDLAKDKKHLQAFKALAYNNLASNYEKKGELALAEQYFEKSYELAKNNENIYYEIKAVILNNLSIIYEAQGKLKDALNIEREAKNLLKETTKKQFDENTIALETFYKTDQKNQKIIQLEEINTHNSKQKTMSILIAILAICLAIFMCFLLNYKQKINKQTTELLTAEKQETEYILRLEQEERNRLKAEQELTHLQQEQLQQKALATTLQLQYKNSFINDLKEKIKDNSNINIDRLLKDERLANDDFNETKNVIQEVHPLFFIKLRNLSSNRLTNQDLKYAAYFYLKMDNQQIAKILKIEPKTVRMAKYRLKQKIGLDKDDDLQQFIQNISF